MTENEMVTPKENSEEVVNEQKNEKIGDFDPNDLDIPVKEPKPSFDATKFEGTRVKIAKVWKDIIESHYVLDDNENSATFGQKLYNPNETEMQDVIFIETEPVTTIGEGENKKDIVVKHKFNLQVDNDGNVYISKYPKTALWKFMRKMGVNTPKELVGKFVTITTEPDKVDASKRWLRIVQ